MYKVIKEQYLLCWRVWHLGESIYEMPFLVKFSIQTASEFSQKSLSTFFL